MAAINVKQIDGDCQLKYFGMGQKVPAGSEHFYRSGKPFNFHAREHLNIDGF
jgi:hypothetical protein